MVNDVYKFFGGDVEIDIVDGFGWVEVVVEIVKGECVFFYEVIMECFCDSDILFE